MDFKRNLPLLNAAVDQVMHGCGWVRRRLRRVIYSALEQAADRGEELPTVALAMISAWKAQENAGPLLRVRHGPEKFIGDGHWRSEDGWHWDHQAIERSRTARLGMM